MHNCSKGHENSAIKVLLNYFNLVYCWLDQVNAAAVTQQMLDLFNVDGIIHFGIAGNANESMSIGDVSIPVKLHIPAFGIGRYEYTYNFNLLSVCYKFLVLFSRQFQL